MSSAENEGNSPPAKRRRIQERLITSEKEDCSILSLSDDMLLMIFSKLSSSSLLGVGDTCSKFRRISEDKSLWREADFTGLPQDLKACKNCLKKLHSTTKSLTLEGLLIKRGKVENISQAFLSDLSSKCPSLERLTFLNSYINGDKIGFGDFPKTLTHLSLKGCEVDNLPSSRSYFKDIHKQIPDILELDLTKCGWVKNHCLMAICKLERLRVLSVQGCFRIGECFAYTALATRFGFEKVERFDLRDTDIGDTEMACFGRKGNLKELLVGGENGDKLTDRGLESLWTTNLEHLCLVNSAVTDNGLYSILMQMKKLRLVDLRGCKLVTEKGVIGCRTMLEESKKNCKLLSDF